MPEFANILTTPATKYIKGSDPNRNEDLLLTVEGLRGELERQDLDMSSLDRPLKVIDAYFSGVRTSAELSQCVLDRSLPEGLLVSLGKNADADEKAKAKEARDEKYHEINNLLIENREISFELLKGEAIKSGLLNISSETPRAEFMANIFGYLNDGKELPESMRIALSAYAEYSWYMVLVNSHLITRIKLGIMANLKKSNIRTSEEDVFQHSLLVAYRLASIYDPTKGAYSTLLGNFLYGMTLTDLMSHEDISINQFSLFLQSENQSETIINASDGKLSEDDTALLAFMLYQRRNNRIKFSDEHVQAALSEIKKVLENRDYDVNENVVSHDLKKTTDFNELLETFKEKLAMIHEISDVQSWEKLPNNYSEGVLRPVEETVIANEENIQALLRKLTPRERSVIEWRYGIADGEEHTPRQISVYLGVTAERVRQLEREAIRKLKRA